MSAEAGNKPRGGLCGARQVLASSIVFAWVALLCSAPPARAIEFWDDRVVIHGAIETQLRAMSEGFRLDSEHWYWSQWANVFSAEMEVDFAPDGFGPFTSIQGYVRVEARFDCVVKRMCGLSPQARYTGKKINRQPRNLADGRHPGLTGRIQYRDSDLLQPDRRRIDFTAIPPNDQLLSVGDPLSIGRTFRELQPAYFTVKYIEGSIGPDVWRMGPMNPDFDIDANGSIKHVSSPTGPLALRPAKSSVWNPSGPLRKRIDDFDSFDQNFTESELFWNRGASQQQTKELKEAYLDIELFDGALFIRAGKQNIVWGKTELFRAQDQFNPQDLALTSLPAFEDSRIGLWGLRMIWSLYDVGPLEDVRLEFAANIDHFEPADLGACGETYTVFLVCGKSAGLFFHGWTGIGLAGELRPDDPWDRWKGLEWGVRAEFRWDRFSFAISNFRGHNDFPTPDLFYTYSRNVDPYTGRPRQAGDFGRCRTELDGADPDPSCLTRANVASNHSANRSVFDAECSATLGLQLNDPLLQDLIGTALTEACGITLFNSQAQLAPLAHSIPTLLSYALSGDVLWNGVLRATLGALVGADLPFMISPHAGNKDDGTGSSRGMSAVLTPAQEALFGCGPFYHGNDEGDAADEPAVTFGPAGSGSCHVKGLDLFNAEASVLFHNFPQYEPRGPVATRFFQGRLWVLPGARSPFDFDPSLPLRGQYDPLVDGCIGDLDDIGLDPAVVAAIPHKSECENVVLRDPDTNDPFTKAQLRKFFRSEASVVSLNLVNLIGSLGATIDDPGVCVPSGDLLDTAWAADCSLVQALFASIGVQRSDLRAGGNGTYGRRDFLWQSGSEISLFYDKRNVFGIAVDFAEDYTKTSWGFEFTWFAENAFINRNKPRGHSQRDVLSLTVSVDRPTFVNFLNANRTIFFNSQWFIRYLPQYERNNVFDEDGPVSLLTTWTLFTGFYQDRLLTFGTFVHEVESNSGGVIFQVIYRFNEDFSGSVGMMRFFGDPRRELIRIVQEAPLNNGNDFTRRFNFQGLSPIGERAEVFLTLRHTF